ncbi:MAG: UPF0261 family protein [Gammaproteobacteria bacterium]|nr:UPF0261 family protein [Gammaproteobacteria bacterium]
MAKKSPETVSLASGFFECGEQIVNDKCIYAIATMDTKAEELGFIAEQLRNTGLEVKTVDVGTGSDSQIPADVTKETVADCHSKGAQYVLGQNDRGVAVTEMSYALESFLQKEYLEDRIAGVIGAGGSGGTSLISRAMRALPIGLPKLLVSTVASGNTQPYIDCSDITLMYSVVDVAGLNDVSRTILANAANAIGGMVRHYVSPDMENKAIGLTMFGVTTPCVDAVRQKLESDDNDCLVFHATGTGGRAMESLVNSDYIDRVLDITTTEVADEVVGGVFPCGEKRFDSIIAKDIPCVMSLGALDMVNFGGIETVPEKFKERNLYPEVTLMRTSVEENVAVAKWMADKINQTTAPFVLVVPEGGVSMLDSPDQPFHDPEADNALFTTLEKLIEQNAKRKILRVARNINDPEFADVLLEQLAEVVTH